VLGDCQLVYLRVLVVPGEGFLKVEKSFIHIGIPGIGHRDTGRPHPGHGSHLEHFFLPDRQRFDILHKKFFHLSGRALSGFDLHENFRIVQIRKKIDSELLKRDISQQDDAQDEHQHRDGIIDGKLCYFFHRTCPAS